MYKSGILLQENVSYDKIFNSVKHGSRIVSSGKEKINDGLFFPSKKYEINIVKKMTNSAL